MPDILKHTTYTVLDKITDGRISLNKISDGKVSSLIEYEGKENVHMFQLSDACFNIVVLKRDIDVKQKAYS